MPDDRAASSAFPGAPPLTPGVHYFTAQSPASGTNGFAIASFVLGLLSIVPLGVIFGIIALAKISGRPQKGKGLAIAGLCLSGVWVLGVTALLVVNSVGTAQRSASTGQITQTGHLSVLQLRAGDCFQSPSGIQVGQLVTQVTALPCTSPHDAQVVAQLPVAGSVYPGGAALDAQAKPGCIARVKADVDLAKLTASTKLLWLYPQAQAWTEGQRTIACVVLDPSTDLTSSLLKTNLTSSLLK